VVNIKICYTYIMARAWTRDEKEKYKIDLERLYLAENKTISEIANIYKLSDSGVFDRLVRLNIPTHRNLKKRFNNQRSDIRIPSRSVTLAEFFGLLMGDGHVSHFQVIVTLGTKELAYARYVRALMHGLFGGVPKISISVLGYKTVYLGSTLLTRWFKQEGMVQNKVAAQVDVPRWIFEKPEYMTAFLRGFFDTDGSIYKLRFGIQLSFTNRSLPLLRSLHRMLELLGYKTSAISVYRVYVTRLPDVVRFFHDIQPANPKHQRRFRAFANHAPVG